MLLGASVSVSAVLAIGPAMILGIAAVVMAAIATSYGLSRALGLPQRMAILVACGNSICGNSAIATVAPVIGADGEDVAASIAFTAVLGVVVVLGLPLLVPLSRMSLTQYGVLAGLTVYAAPQVLAATLPIGALSNQVGTVVKLVRVLRLGPVVLAVSLLASRLREESDEAAPHVTAGDHPKPRRPPLHRLAPWFIVGFLIVAGLRTTGRLPTSALPLTAWVANGLTTVSMAALRLGGGCQGRGEGGAAGDGGGHAVAHRARRDQLRTHQMHRRSVRERRAIQNGGSAIRSSCLKSPLAPRP